MKIQKISIMGDIYLDDGTEDGVERDRLETGVTQYDEDWPGVFIRGDNCKGFVTDLKKVLEYADHYDTPSATVEELIELLEAAERK